MPREIKIILFASIILIFGASFIGKLVETGSVVSALIFCGQIALLFVGTLVSLLVLIWIGSKIFKE